MILGTAPKIAPSARSTVDAQRLIAVALKGLPQMFDPKKRLFCYTLRKTEKGLVQVGISQRYTVITLMGLHRLEQSGRRSPIEIRPVLNALFADTSWLDNIGDVGLLLWLCALVAPERIAELESRCGLHAALKLYPDAKQGRTMELAWFLAGLSHWGLSAPEVLPKIRRLASETFRLLSQNQGPHGAFGHLALNQSLTGRIRGRIGSFADQVYPIYAMSRFFQAYGEPSAEERALSCARLICEAQGPLGQWWWHYDSARGNVAEGYPVFSVHQHGMAPMTLFALEEATLAGFSAKAYKGLTWLSRRNELSVEMKDASESLYWRCIFQPALQRYWHAAINSRASRKEFQSTHGLKVLFECRPYELGWLLYAFADRIAGGD